MADGFLGIDLVAAFTLFGPAPVFMLLLCLFPCSCPGERRTREQR